MAIKPSLRLATLLLLIHAIVAVVVCMIAIPLAARLAILMLILLSLFYYLARDALLLLPCSWLGIAFENHPQTYLLPEGESMFASSPASGRGLRKGLGSVSLTARDGSYFSGQFASGTAVSPYFAVLSVKLEGHRLPIFLTIFPDALGSGAFRELCVLLKFAW